MTYSWSPGLTPITVEELEHRFEEVCEEVAKGFPGYMITVNGEPVAVIVPPRLYEELINQCGVECSDQHTYSLASGCSLESDGDAP